MTLSCERGGVKDRQSALQTQCGQWCGERKPFDLGRAGFGFGFDCERAAFACQVASDARNGEEEATRLGLP
jgi:hypothetical protein